VQLCRVAFDEVVGDGDELRLQLAGGLQQFVFGVGGALLALGAAAAEEVLGAQLSLADGFEGADEDLGLVKDDEQVRVAGVVGAADEVVEAKAEGEVVERAGEGDGVAVDLVRCQFKVVFARNFSFSLMQDLR
jgi:hypothetical protein